LEWIAKLAFLSVGLGVLGLSEVVDPWATNLLFGQRALAELITTVVNLLVLI
jgi:hypothetical protein